MPGFITAAHGGDLIPASPPQGVLDAIAAAARRSAWFESIGLQVRFLTGSGGRIGMEIYDQRTETSIELDPVAALKPICDDLPDSG